MDDRTAALADVVRRLPSEELEVHSPVGVRVYRGVSLFNYAVAAGLISADGGSAIERGYFVVSAGDGGRAALSVAELAPMVTDRRVLLAVEQDGEPIRIGLRLVVPREGSRSLVGVTEIAFREASPSYLERAGGVGGSLNGQRIMIGGIIPRPGLHDLAATVEPIEVETVTANSHGQQVPPRRYTGIPIHRLLGEAGMYSMTDGEDLHQKVVVATGADGHVAVIAAGEFGPQSMKNPAIAATARDDSPLAEAEGPIRLLTPDDRIAARWVRHLVSLELREA